MTINKDTLLKLAAFIEEIANNAEYEWFNNLLISKLHSIKNATINHSLSEFDIIIEELKRTKYFLKNIDKTYWLEARNFYTNVIDDTVRLSLMIDYKEMKVAEIENNIVEFTRRLVMQLENGVSYACNKLDAHKHILKDPEKYKNKNTNLRNGEFSFFNNDGSNKPTNKVNLPSKVFFLKQYYGFNYNFIIFNEMITIRNKSSHRGEMNDMEIKVLQEAKDNPQIKKNDYFHCFNSIFRNILVLYKEE